MLNDTYLIISISYYNLYPSSIFASKKADRFGFAPPALQIEEKASKSSQSVDSMSGVLDSNTHRVIDQSESEISSEDSLILSELKKKVTSFRDGAKLSPVEEQDIIWEATKVFGPVMGPNARFLGDFAVVSARTKEELAKIMIESPVLRWERPRIMSIRKA